MSKIVAVFGATGSQGSGIISELLGDKNFKVRAITRNTNSEKAKALLAQDVEVIHGDLEDPKSVANAIDGAYAVYGVTDYWQYIVENGNIEAGNIETRVGKSLVDIVATSPTLQHFIWSSMPDATAEGPGGVEVPHFSAKNRVEIYIKQRYPELAAKTTFLRVAWYAENLATYPFFTPQKYGGTGEYILIQPCSPKTLIPMAGSGKKNVGLVIHAVLRQPERCTPSKTVITWLGYGLTYPQLLEIWSKVTGKKVTYIQCTTESYIALYPDTGYEIALQCMYLESMANRAMDGPDMIDPSELGVTRLMGVEETLRSMQGSWD